MNLLKKTFLALAVAVSLGLLGASSASAVTVQCSAFAVPTLVRSQGLTELTGNIILNCNTAGVPTANPGSASSVTVTISPPTANITNSTGSLPTMVNSGTAVVTNPLIVNGNTVTFGLDGVGTLGNLTIQNVRVNASASGVVFPSQIQALITASPAINIAVTNNQLNVAIPQSGISIALGAGSGLPQCASASFAGLADAPATIKITAVVGDGVFTTTDNSLSGKSLKGAGTTANVTASEGYPAAWHTFTDEGASATNGTRILINFAALPTNVVLYAPEELDTEATGFKGVAKLVLVAAGTDGSLNEIANAAAKNPALADLITTASVTYEVFVDDDANLDGFNIPIQIFTSGTPSPVGAITMTAALAPTSSIGTSAAAGTPIPRFAPSTASGTATSIIPCTTNILVPWAANIAGFDTGFAIANTTSDIFGTSSQSGTCIYNFFGNNPPSGGTFTTASFGGGTTDTRILSAIAPGFSGYIMIQCNFQLGHGFSFLQNGFGGGAVTVGQGGPVLIIPQPGTTGSKSRKGLAAVGPPFGEGLSH